MALHALETCAGYGGLSLALRLAGLDVRTVAYVERETHAAATLVARMEDEALDRAPIWDDLATFPADEFHGVVDIVTGGIPCQPFSSAGRQRGLDDERWLWPALWDVVLRCGAEWLFVENVPQFRKHGLAAVLADLREAGWDAEWMLLSAADVGAPHKRERFWLLAHRQGTGLEGRGLPGWACSDSGDVAHGHGHGREGVGRGTARGERDPDGRRGADVGHAGSERRQQDAGRTPRDEGAHGWWSDRGHVTDGPVEDVGDTPSVDEREPDHETSAVAWGESRAHARGSSIWPPGRDDHDGWATWIANGGPEPQLRREPDGVTGRLVRPAGLPDRLHLLGNGVVPACAAVAFRVLAGRLLT